MEEAAHRWQRLLVYLDSSWPFVLPLYTNDLLTPPY